ncbi:MAG TPA: DEAD/DEAH box helicase family protein [Thermoleophilaceae bacterium]|nr:DEAD/DEAH box helicase family protein [Thermoleophilaceae bacterium]
MSAAHAAPPHKELAFEELIENHLLDHGWEQGTAYSFDRELGIDFDELLTFIGATQEDAWHELVERRGGVDVAQREFRKLVARRIDDLGTLHVLRRGVTDLGVDFRLAYFKPEHGLTPELVAGYAANRCTVVRQLAYSEREPDKTLELVLLVNGIPTATAELKNPLTGQNVEHAKYQYRHDRAPSEPIFARRAPVHFAVDPSLVFLTTRLQGEETVFLPFNQGSEGPGEPGGAGNRPAVGNRHATAYLWEEVWNRDAWLELLHRFIHIEPSAPRRGGGRRGKEQATSGNPIFPRFQQWDAVRRLVADARRHGAGRNYLVQHSAGSGKSNTIAWLAHRLAGLHADDRKVFDKVIVITDRVVLDRQLQATIFQFDHEPGVVQKVEGTSAQLGEALESSTAKIIVSTLQKFPFVLKRIGDLSNKRFAVIVDEAHSSQSGEAAKALRGALGSGGPDEDEERDAEPDEVEEMTAALIERSARERGQQPNLSYFAFTATPTNRTLHVFGDREAGELLPFHTYSMRQAIEERFILDVLRRFMPYRVFWKVAATLDEDPDVERRKAATEIVRFVSAQPQALEEKAQVIVEHFRSATRKLIGGRAKAMVVTASRELAVRTHFALEAYIRAQGYTDCEPLVAFSGTVELDGEPWTEARINNFGEKQLADRFAEDRYRILTVAEKYQTGFDQPLLHTMYVDKQLGGLRAVQTLSRLNRTHPQKDDTFVLDFVNSAEDIRAAFKPWYEETRALPTDPNELFSAREALLAFGIVREEEEAGFAAALLAGGDGVHALLYAHLEPAKVRFEALDEQDRREFHAAAAKFCELYSFLAQGMSFMDARLERTYLYARALQRVLPRERSQSLDLGDSLELTHLRIQVGAETDAGVEGDAEPMSPEDAQVAVGEPAVDPLSQIIRELNERHGLQLGAGDEIVRRMTESLVDDEELKEAAAANSFANFELLFDEKFEERALEARNQSWEFFERAFGDEEVRGQLEDTLAREVYARLTGKHTWRDRLGGTSLTEAERAAVERFVERVHGSLGDDLEGIWLYGSKARGDDTERSDVDLLVLARGGRERHREVVAGIARALEKLDGDGCVVLSAAVQDRDWLAERREIEDFFVRDLDRDKIVLFGGP